MGWTVVATTEPTKNQTLGSLKTEGAQRKREESSFGTSDGVPGHGLRGGGQDVGIETRCATAHPHLAAIESCGPRPPFDMRKLKRRIAWGLDRPLLGPNPTRKGRRVSGSQRQSLVDQPSSKSPSTLTSGMDAFINVVMVVFLELSRKWESS